MRFLYVNVFTVQNCICSLLELIWLDYGAVSYFNFLFVANDS